MYCFQYGALLDHVYAAAARYHAAATRLHSLVGTQSPTLFDEVKRECVVCRTDCRRAVASLNAHTDAHGCTHEIV
jgi:hypothetical protein